MLQDTNRVAATQRTARTTTIHGGIGDGVGRGDKRWLIGVGGVWPRGATELGRQRAQNNTKSRKDRRRRSNRTGDDFVEAGVRRLRIGLTFQGRGHLL